MDYQGRRRRRGRCRSRPNLTFQPCPVQRNDKPWSFVSGLYSFVIMSSLMALIYIMLEYHCSTCNIRYDNMKNITKIIEDISNNLSGMKDSYYDLEMKISKFSRELPKVEGEIEILEALANTIGSKDGWNPKTHLTLPNVDVYLTRPGHDKSSNISVKCTKHLPEAVLVNID